MGEKKRQEDKNQIIVNLSDGDILYDTKYFWHFVIFSNLLTQIQTITLRRD